MKVTERKGASLRIPKRRRRDTKVNELKDWPTLAIWSLKK